MNAYDGLSTMLGAAIIIMDQTDTGPALRGVTGQWEGDTDPTGLITL